MSLNYRNDPEFEKASEAVNSQLKLWNEGKKLSDLIKKMFDCLQFIMTEDNQYCTNSELKGTRKLLFTQLFPGERKDNLRYLHNIAVNYYFFAPCRAE